MQGARSTAWGWAALGKAGGSSVGGDLRGDPSTLLICLLQSSIFSGFALLSSSSPHVSPTFAKAAGMWSQEEGSACWAGWELPPDFSLSFLWGPVQQATLVSQHPNMGDLLLTPLKSQGMQQKAAAEMYRIWAHCPCVGWACKPDGERRVGGTSPKTGVKIVQNL